MEARLKRPAFVVSIPTRHKPIPSSQRSTISYSLAKSGITHRNQCTHSPFGYRTHPALGAPRQTSSTICAALKPYLEKLIARKDLEESEVCLALDEALDSSASPEELAAFLVLLAAKGETSEEISSLAKTLKQRMISVDTKGYDVLDIVGTGGDGPSTINISTAASVVAAACGAKVAKHGNRSASSLCGSADVLEYLGVNLEASSDTVSKCIVEGGIGFMFAPKFHPAMMLVVPVRRKLKVRTVFNIMGPLINPAGATRGVIGVYDKKYSRVMAETLKLLGAKHIIVVNTDGVDEFTTTGKANVVELKNGQIAEWEFDAQDIGIPRCNVEELKGGDAKVNSEILTSILKGEKPGPMEDAVVLNAGVGLYVGGAAPDIKSGVEKAYACVRSGKPYETLQRWIQLSQG